MNNEIENIISHIQPEEDSEKMLNYIEELKQQNKYLTEQNKAFQEQYNTSGDIIRNLRKENEMKEYVFNLPKGSSFEVKRFYFDGIIEHPCPCGGTLIRDFSKWYLSYPEIGEDEIISLCCDTCGEHYKFKGRIEKMAITLSLDLESMERN